MSNPFVRDGDGGLVGSWDKNNGVLEMDNGGPDMRVDSDGSAYDSNGNYVGRIDSNGRLS